MRGRSRVTWSLCVTQPRAEFRASRMLERFGFNNHVFKHQVTGAHRGRFVKRLVPAFPGYLFVYVVDESREQLHRLWDFFRLRSFVSVGNTSEIAESALNELLARAATEDILPVDNECAARFKFGDRIQIVTGLHAAFGHEGIYQHTVKPGRVLILLPILGQLAPTEVSEADIELASKIQASQKRNNRKRKRRGGRNRARWRPGRSPMYGQGSLRVDIGCVHAR